jgi:hypothetical protein
MLACALSAAAMLTKKRATTGTGEGGTGEEAIAACGRLLALDPNNAVT